MYAANADLCRGRKCEDWHNSKITEVTRHILKDVEHDSDMKGKIKALKSRRFKNPEERWHHYYGLFLNPAVAHQDEPQPYWLSHVSRGPSDHLQHYLDTRITEHPDEAIFLHRYTSLKERRQHRIKSVELHFEQKKITERLKIEAEYDKEVDALLSQVKKHRAGMVAEQQRPTDAATADLTIGQQEGQDQVLLHTVGNSTEMNMLKLHETTSDVAGSAATGSHGFNVQLDHYRRQVQTYPPIISDIPEATDQNLNYAGQHMAKLLEFVEDAETAANYPDTDTYPAESSGTHNHNVNVQQFGLQAQSQHDKLPPRMAQGDSTYGTLFLPNENPRYFPHGPGTFTEMTSQSLDIDDENYGGWYSQYTNSQDDTR